MRNLLSVHFYIRMQAGFSFVVAHSEGLFEQAEPTRKDVEANLEAATSDGIALHLELCNSCRS